MLSKFPNYRQSETKDCGPTCIRIVSKFYGRLLNIEDLRQLSETNRQGSSLLGLSRAAEKLGFRTIGAKIDYNKLLEVPLPCILHWTNDHFVVLYKIKKDRLFISDPAKGLITYHKIEFLQAWIGNNVKEDTREGVILLIEPRAEFYSNQYSFPENKKLDFSYISKYLIKYRKFIVQLIIGLIAASLLQLVVPFLTQSIVDVGIKNQDIDFIYLILFAQLFLFAGRTILEIIRSWILLHLSTRINISLISDFFIKLMNLPISYFDSKMTGDLLQRINDHKRIEKILTTSSLNVLFSIFNFLIFGLILAYYSLLIFSVFLGGTILYFTWILLLLKKRKVLDHKNFSILSEEQSKVIELINGMQEIKLNNAERRMRWNWEYLQARLFKLGIKSLSLEQTQSAGSSFINEFKNILITIISAKLVIDGNITLGMMLAISYIVGQLNAPINQFISFIRDFQDAQISLERLGEIHNKKDEENSKDKKIKEFPMNLDITLRKVTFRYQASQEPVIADLDLTVASNKVTAIVGASGSGKTTLMKLLLRFYHLDNGEIKIGENNIQNISIKSWRNQCGTVMQEGYIFNDTIAQNIAVCQNYIDQTRLVNAVKVANIKDFIEKLPLGYNSKIGLEGIGLSTGQKQRILIARAVYKNPKILFFDEATSALDANNEKVIMENLEEFFLNKTVLIIAHRLSTVKNAHQIVLLKDGKIAELGNHKELIKLKGEYFKLIKNQLELGN